MRHTLLFLCLFSLFISSCTKREKDYVRVGFAFDTVCSVQIFTKGNEKEANVILDQIFEKLNQLEFIFSPTLKESELSKFNEAPTDVSVKLSDELYYVVKENLKVAKETNGAFNPFLGKVTKLWRPLWQNISESEGHPSLPTEADIAGALQRVDYQSIVLQDRTAKKIKDVELDLGASAKGYATDCIKDILLKAGIKRAIIDLGGNIAVLNKKENGDLWKVGIKMPIVHSQGRVAGYLETCDRAVVTSGNYERFVEVEGKLYHHIISGKTGKPVDNELRAVTIVSPNALLADILSTSCFVLGKKEGQKLLKQFPSTFAIFFFKDASVIEVNGEAEHFNIIDNSLRKVKEK